MPILYSALGRDKRISDIVFAGSHDASIIGGKSNAMTQSLDIKGQAIAGVRLFDLRIAAMGNGDGASLVGYHGSLGGKKKVSLNSSHTGKTSEVVTNSKMKLGTFGDKLSTMLTQGRDFVATTGEFLIFKFDKCKNWQLIAEYCVALLGNNIYKPANPTFPFGKLTLGDLKAKVVCVFSESGLTEIKGLGVDDGIIGFRSLKGDDGIKPYQVNYPGLQYYGKGGTSLLKGAFKGYSGKRDLNVDKQRKLMLQMAAVQEQWAADVLGMMYWTSTGLVESIKKRNDYMWNTVNVKRMADIWRGGLEASIEVQLKLNEIKYMEYGEHRRMKAFFPNIVMVDFADAGKCDTIYELNEVADEMLIKAFDKYCEPA